MTERERKLIEALANAKAPSGFEDETVAIMREALRDLCDFEEDGLRNLFIRRRRNTGDKPVLMLDAHSDEVGFMVHSIRPNGTLRLVGLGGWNKATLPGATHNTAFLQATGVLPDCSSTDGVTLEFYATLNQMLSWQRLFTLCTSDLASGLCATWGWDTDASGDVYSFRTAWTDSTQYNVLASGTTPWIVGTEYHVSLVFAKTASGFDLTIARRNATTGEVIVSNTISVTWSPATLSSMILRLGWSWDNSSDASGSFDEVRVWNHALTDDEIVAGIQAGKGAIPFRASGVGVASLPSGTTLSVASGATLLLCGASQTVASAAVSGTVADPGTLTAADGIFPGGDGTIGTMTVAGSATLAGDMVLDFATDGTCDRIVFAPGGTYDVSQIRLVPSDSGLAAWRNLRRFVIGSAAGATLTGSFDLSALSNARIRQRDNGDLELSSPKAFIFSVR